MHKLMIERAMDWHDDDIQHVREQRKFFANLEQSQEIDKAMRKICQRYKKATTLVLEHMTGMKNGKWEGEPLHKQVFIPLELEEVVRNVFMFTVCRIHYKDLYSGN